MPRLKIEHIELTTSPPTPTTPPTQPTWNIVLVGYTVASPNVLTTIATFPNLNGPAAAAMVDILKHATTAGWEDEVSARDKLAVKIDLSKVPSLLFLSDVVLENV